MGSATSPAATELFWVKSQPQGRYDLVLNNEILGWLQHGDYWNSESRAHIAGQNWLFQRPGTALGSTEILQDDEARVRLAGYKSHWGGGGTLTLSDGSRFLLSCTGVWRHIWSLLDENGEPVLRIEPHTGKVFLSHGQSINLFRKDEKRTLLLLAFVWHEILQSQDEAEMVAVMNATS